MYHAISWGPERIKMQKKGNFALFSDFWSWNISLHLPCTRNYTNSLPASQAITLRLELNSQISWVSSLQMADSGTFQPPQLLIPYVNLHICMFILLVLFLQRHLLIEWVSVLWTLIATSDHMDRRHNRLRAEAVFHCCNPSSWSSFQDIQRSSVYFPYSSISCKTFRY